MRAFTSALKSLRHKPAVAILCHFFWGIWAAGGIARYNCDVNRLPKEGIVKSLKFILLAALVAAPLAATAREGSYFYAGVGIGDGKLKIENIDDAGTNFDENDWTWKIFGGWNFNKYFGFEVAWVDLSEYTQTLDLSDGEGGTIPTDVRIAADGIETYLTATLPFEMFQVYAKGGYFWYDAEATFSDAFGSVRGSDSDGTWAWAFGVGFVLMDKIPINLEYEIFDIEDVDDAEVIWLTAAWRF
jgi:opacity protein-like surface antigen